jgi:methylenetetrahydrofolate dehydrogenase (NADP+)/methenyltetrahydrofolate cyclohydrolase
MIINGKKIAEEIYLTIKKKISSLKTSPPKLAVILVGDNLVSKTYIRLKHKACDDVGILFTCLEMDINTTEDMLIKEIKKLNKDVNIDGILVQLPLPAHINTDVIIETVDPMKDVDGFHPLNMGKLLIGRKDGFLPSTPYGIKMLLEQANIAVEHKHVVIVGRSNIVGKPMAAILMQKAKGCNATVTIAHSGTDNLKDITKSADILIVAIGKPKCIGPDMVKQNSVIIDVGINYIIQNGKKVLCGDVDFDKVSSKVAYITPVPGGVGPMTIAALLTNTLKAHEIKL